MNIYRDYDLTKLNTFGVSAKARFFAAIINENDLASLFSAPEFKQNTKMFLGGGSNVLFTKDFDGMVVLNKLKGINILAEDSETVTVRSMGGEIWHDLVLFAVNRDYWGIENLSSIPGTVSAAPIQNIGAYGAELNDTLLNVEAFEIETGDKKIFNKKECQLGYRDSVFKNELKGQYFISAVTLKLSKKEKKNVTYKILQEYLEKNKIEIKSPKDISEAVTSIRKGKLPDPAIIGNVGSFFKNVFLSRRSGSEGGTKSKLEELLKKYPEMPYFKEPVGALALSNENEMIKIPAGWLIEQTGPESGTSWKGKRFGRVGVHEKQALVLVNYGGATGAEILELAEKITISVREKFGLELIPEVNLI